MKVSELAQEFKTTSEHVLEKLKSLICAYDRANRLGIDENILRFEYRLKGPRYISFLNLLDLDISVSELAVIIKPYLIKYTKKVMNPSVIFDIQIATMVKHNLYLLEIFLNCGFRSYQAIKHSREGRNKPVSISYQK